MPVLLACNVRCRIPLLRDQTGRAETGRTRLPYAADQLKRGFEAALGLALQVALQWP